jgi:hypothetical protein
MIIGHNLAKFAKQQVQPILYSYNVLKVATKDFHPSNKLGEGGFGAVYKVNSYFNFLIKFLNVFPSFNV